MVSNPYLKGHSHSYAKRTTPPPRSRKFETDIMGSSPYSPLHPEWIMSYGSVEDTSEIELAESEDSKKDDTTCPFCWLEYCSFFAIGMSMMWTWSMILQAVPYYQKRFKSNAWILQYFQSCNLCVFSVTILSATLFLTKAEKDVDYKGRLRASLLAYVLVAGLLTISTSGMVASGPELYFIFLLVMVFITAVANGLSQNSAFAFAAGFGRTEYAPAIMTGEALAGLLPSTIEIVSALAFPSSYFDAGLSRASKTSLLTTSYFFLGVCFGAISLCALAFLRKRSRRQPTDYFQPKNYELRTLWSKLSWPASANFLCLCISSVSPVFITKIVSVVQSSQAPILLRPEAFIPLAIVLWNIGDLLGSMLSVFCEELTRRPYLLLILSLARIAFIPLYLMCNIDGRGSMTGDWFYLIVVQFLFGLTHGWISGISMMGVPNWVEAEEREAAGAFMGMSLVTGLVAGSFLGLFAARA